jgi:hypothetical protein
MAELSPRASTFTVSVDSLISPKVLDFYSPIDTVEAP